MGTADESTQDLLKSYGANGSNPSKLQDELSVYSMSKESPKRDDLSDLYDLLEDDSIEIKRGSMSILESPKYTSSPQKLSPTKKLRNDYQNYIYQMRNGQADDSPIKKKKSLQHNHNHNHNSFESSRIFGSERSENSLDNFERDVDKFLNEAEVSKAKKVRSELLESNDNDKSELIIQQTHKVLNEYSKNALGSTEEQKLKSTLNQLSRTIETLRNENSTLREKNISLELKYQNVDNDYAKLRDSYSKLQADLIQLQRKFDQKSKYEDSTLKRDNELLGQKLKKYKSLYNNLIEKDKKITIEKVPVQVPEPPKEKEKLSISDLKKLLVEEQEASKKSEDSDKNVKALADSLYKFILEYSKERDEKSNLNSNLNSNSNEKQSDLWISVSQALQTNNEIIKNLAEEIPRPVEQSQSQTQTQSKPNPIVVKCYVCHERQDQLVNDGNKVNTNINTKRICSRCASVNSQISSEPEKNDTLKMIGEYKWEI
ncbi:uncharacterized protein RJT21DRAFT_116860 [Scheffersomyces amazonensis]|uniref:uncharacterized protein n=1 Tax=Scheffersomyces amazonensis TaxID=1078765 RepID=UPI00315D14CB